MIVVCTAMIIAMMEAHQVIFVAPLTLMIVQEEVMKKIRALSDQMMNVRQKGDVQEEINLMKMQTPVQEGSRIHAKVEPQMLQLLLLNK